MKAISKIGQQQPFSDWGIPEVLCHNDFWCNNILVRKDSATGSHTDELAAIIDWQVDKPLGHCTANDWYI